ncbi:hypothetical protein NTE_03267 [Candidatus Nitrososphaera evergladensis SR1]|jgi:hypothetical protein|uniref:Uncharacterized protein n=1 Tax=Candidatus Nitrososphaera evergladensis SR1 TaxID=1459636 RepID=A0A075MUF6_9ARCH|nr:hypothetical protein [Candidatus Nitrososphaera evergladensis]AIF85296.1 hypothetical protein NTE_03267 [Candidatus Nitrososphaera evergladensis SR1]
MEQGRRHSKQTLKFSAQRLDNMTPELLAKSMWVSTGMAMIFSLPPLGLFIGLYEAEMHIGVAAGIGFGVHFATLAFSRRIAAGLSKLFD